MIDGPPKVKQTAALLTGKIIPVRCGQAMWRVRPPIACAAKTVAISSSAALP